MTDAAAPTPAVPVPADPGFTPVFLLYVPRSGSTFLAEKIATRIPEVCVLPELDIFKPLFLRGAARIARTGPEDWAAWLFEDPRMVNTNMTQAEFAQAFREDSCRTVGDIVASICRLYRSRNRPGARYVLLKKGEDIRFLDRIARIFPEAAYLHIYRDPRAVVNSQIGQERIHHPGTVMGRGDVRHIALCWRDYLGRFAALESAGGRTLAVRYEDMVTDLPATLGRLADWLDVAVAERVAGGQAGGQAGGIQLSEIEAADLHKRVKAPADVSRIDAWRTRLGPDQVFVIEDICGAVMAARGYGLDQVGRVPASRAAWLRARAWLNSVNRARRHYLHRARQVLCKHGALRFFQLVRLRLTSRRGSGG